MISTIWELEDITNHLCGRNRQSASPEMRTLVRQRLTSNPCLAIMGESYFSADGDDDISKVVTESKPLSWRGDPNETYSDWTIVVATNDFDSRTYHVHKSILSVGPRSSKYFARLFHEQANHYHQTQMTKIELDEQDALCFPLMLDFMYNASQSDLRNDDDSLSLVVGEDFTTSNAVSLRHLARVFDCEGLMLAVNKFIQKDLSLKTGPVYLTQAYYYQDERLIESAKRLCVDNFVHLETRAITRLPLALFRLLIHAVVGKSKVMPKFEQEDEDALSYQLSEVVCQYFEKHPEALTTELLLELTDESIMPKLASEPAIGFTALARELNPTIDSAESEEWKGLVALCQRCANAVVGEYGWKDFSVESALEEYVSGPCCLDKSKMDSLLFATSFAAALSQAQKDYKAVSKNTNGTMQELFKLQKENEQLEALNRSQKEEVDRYKYLLANTKEELILLRQQVKELRKRQNGAKPPIANGCYVPQGSGPLDTL